MSTTKHSEGPWWVTESGIRNRAGYICFTRPATRFDGQDERFARESAERAADKHLIASAPEMANALSFLCGLHPEVTIDGPPMQVAERIFDAVIADRASLNDRIKALEKNIDWMRGRPTKGEEAS